MIRSTEAPAWDQVTGWKWICSSTVPAPASTINDQSKSNSDGGSCQKFMLFIQRNAILGDPVINGISKFLNLPI